MENTIKTWCYHCMLEEKQEGESCSICNSDGVKENPEEFLPLGSELKEGRFLIGEFLGHVGQIATYIARDLEKNKVVLIKEFFPLPDVTREEESASLHITKENNLRFKTLKSDFVDLYQKLEGMKLCENVEKVYCLFEENNTSYAVTKPVRGITLREYVSNFPSGMKVSIAKQIAEEMLQAVEELHQNGIIHGMINPDTVLFDRKKNIVFQDFVLLTAKEKAEDQHVGFMAPEQYTNATFQGTYSDVYAVAACFYWMVTLIEPQKADGDADSYTILVELNKLPEDTPEYVKKAIQKALQVKIGERTDKAVRFLKALQSGANTPLEEPEVGIVEEETEEEEDQKKEPRVGGRNWLAFAATLLVTLGVMTAFFFSDIGTKMIDGFFNKDETEITSTEGGEHNDDTVPNLVGMSKTEAEAKMKKDYNHFRYKFAYTYVSNEENEDKIIVQSPKGGTKSSHGATIVLTVGKINDNSSNSSEE